jgi:hypothetical protein
MLLNEARYRTIERVLGIPRDQANLATLIAVLLIADQVRERTRRVLTAPGAPSTGDVLLGAGVLRGVSAAVAGPGASDSPLFGTVITIALLGGPSRRVLIRSLRGIKSSSGRATVGFRRRYGYLVDPGHLRHRRAERRGREWVSSPSQGA